MKISPPSPSRYSSTPDTPDSDQLRPNSSTLSCPITCSAPATSVTSSRPTHRHRM